ncbi:YlbF family regulator [Bacillus sp. FJAT-49736]|uniref:YlbF family regulator n=1 Tax=Bacillus sp. FJAT-49736 TaxID=2833582 RepID=UPI001BC8E321|nr:YlbF family regulator [Bacillus sp. FJAT-49736]MBS4172398.1 YlbF family regulator [Bacillus sp. FJAT-49736]
MLATIERLEVVSEAEILARMVLQSDTAIKYRKAYYSLKNDPETQRKIAEFVRMKDLYEDVQRFGRYHPDYKYINQKTREAKREMDLDENVAQFRKAENELQQILDEISVIVGKSVSEYIKVPTGNPFFDSGSSCSGGCGSGGACGCSA